MGMRGNIRRDKKHRVLRAGESIRSDGKYQFKYQVKQGYCQHSAYSRNKPQLNYSRPEKRNR